MKKNADSKLERRLRSTIIGGILVIFVFSVVVKIVNLPQFHVKDETITRNLGWLILPMGAEPTERTTAWDSELPEFVQKDLEYAEEHGYQVRYQFKGNSMRIELQENEWVLYLESSDSEVNGKTFRNFSIYVSEDHKIVIYGHLHPGGCFQKVTFFKNEVKIKTVTYDTAPEFNLRDNTIARNLANLTAMMDLEPSGRTVAWGSEFPEFVKRDMEYAEKHGSDIEYEFNGNVIRIEKREEIWRLAVETRMDIGSIWDYLTNFSIYQVEGNEVIIYGYTYGGSCFQKITLQKNESRIDTITYNSDLPLDEFSGSDSIGAVKVGEYLLVRKEQTFKFYKEGKLISSQDFHEEKIEDADLYRGLLLTEEKKLYMMYVILKEEKPRLVFTYIDTVDAIIKTHSYRNNLTEVQTDEVYLSMVQKNGKYYAVIPNSWRSFDEFSVARSEDEIHSPNGEIDYFVVLKNLAASYKESCFHYRTRWYVTIVFNLNGRDFYVEYSFGGYDESTNLPEEIADSFKEKTATSFDEMWETIENIRKAYFDYYESRGDFVPTAPF